MSNASANAIENAILEQKMQQFHDKFFAEIDRYDEEKKAEQLYFQSRNAYEFKVLMLRQRMEETMMRAYAHQTLALMRTLQCTPEYAMAFQNELIRQNTLSLEYAQRRMHNPYM